MLPNLILPIWFGTAAAQRMNWALGLDLPPSCTQSQTTRLKTKGAKPKISEGTVVQKSTELGKLQPPGTQNSLPSLKVALPLKGPRPASVPEPVNIYEKEEDHVYEADDEDEHFLHKGHRPTPRATISPLNTSHGWEDKLQRLQDMIEIIGQKTVYFDKTPDLLTKERIKTSKLTDMLEQLQDENKTLKQLINTQPNSEPEGFPTAAKTSQSQCNSPEPFYPPTPVIQECAINQTLPTLIEISEERGESLEEQNNILKNEIKEMKAKLAKQDLEKENNNLKKELEMLKEKLQSSDEKHNKETGKVPENNQVKVKSPKNRQVIIAGDSMLNNIEEKFDLNTKPQMLVFARFQEQPLKT